MNQVHGMTKLQCGKMRECLQDLFKAIIVYLSYTTGQRSTVSVKRGT